MLCLSGTSHADEQIPKGNDGADVLECLVGTSLIVHLSGRVEAKGKVILVDPCTGTIPHVAQWNS
jgi:hypothetical protein